MQYPKFIFTAIYFLTNLLAAQDYCTRNHIVPENPVQNPANLSAIDVAHYDINLQVEPETGQISGSVSVVFSAETALSDMIELDFAALTIDSVYHENMVTTYARTATVLAIKLLSDIAAGDTSLVTVFYRGSPQRGLYFRQNEAGEVVVYSHNEPYDARFWIPCKDNPADKAMMNMTILLPPGYQVLSNGLLTGVSSGPFGTIFAWRETYPIATYLISIAAAPYRLVESVYQDIEGIIPLQYYVYEGDQDRAGNALQSTVEMMQFFGDYIGPYPFRKEKYAMSAVPFREATAMENQTATTMRDNIIDNEEIIAHELAHQWWGDAVSPQSFAHIWLNEGFATYFDALFTEHRYGRLAFEQRMQDFSGNIYTDGSLDYPILNPPPQYLFGRAVYYKGAWVLHMLRNKIGDPTFREICRQYYQLHLYKNAITDDFISASEAVSGQPLSNFFNQWLNYGGIPELAGSWIQKNRTLEIVLKQTQTEILYDLRLDLKIEGSKVDTTIQVDLNTAAGRWLVDFNETVNRILIDPQNKILQRNNGPLYNIPNQTALVRLYPNPFNQRITIEYAVGIAEEINIAILNTLGQKVAELEHDKKNNGIYTVTWDGSTHSSGVYVCRLTSKSQREYRKIVLIK